MGASEGVRVDFWKAPPATAEIDQYRRRGRDPCTAFGPNSVLHHARPRTLSIKARVRCGRSVHSATDADEFVFKIRAVDADVFDEFGTQISVDADARNER